MSYDEIGMPAEHVVPADRFARKISGFGKFSLRARCG
jgi:hypothetical protein